MNARTMMTMTAILTMSACLTARSEDLRKAYRVPVTPAQSGGPVRAISTSGAEAPAQLLVRTCNELPEAKQQQIAWHFRNAARLAETFAKKEGVQIQRSSLPARVDLFKSPEGLAQATGLPASERLGDVVARINLKTGVVYLGRKTPEDLYVELGKWLFYERGYRWGQNESADRAHLDLAERFATFCLDEKNWTEAGGTKAGLR
ncbi:MAG: hypothetical protein KIS92_26370 [Planctomycetota bacterium]|nr:hypothetical protein [Planctomycetota bacterium]